MKKQGDLTSGGILKKLLLVAIPIMGTSLLQMAYNLTDMFWLGQLRGEASVAAVAASGSAGMYLWLSMAFLLVGRMGAEIGVSQSIGRRDLPAAQGYAQGAILWAAGLGVLVGILMAALNRPLIVALNIHDPVLVRDGGDYLAIAAIGGPFSFVGAAITGVFNGSGNSKVSFQANMIGLVVNMILDPLMIHVFGWGIHGAAIATVLAQIIVCVLFVVFLRGHAHRPFEQFLFRVRPQMVVLKQIVRWSLPTCVESFFFTLLAMVTSRLVNAYGGHAMAAQRIGAQIESLSWLIGGGFGTAVTAFMGQNYGARKWARIHRGFRLSMLAMAVWGIIVTVGMYFGGRLLFSIFVQEEAVLALGERYLRIFATCQLMTCVEAVAAGALRGMGRTKPPAMISTVCNGIRVALAFALDAAWGLYGVWWAVTLSAVLRGVVMLCWYLYYASHQPKEDELLPTPAEA